ncbi:WD repeat-containing protein 73-like [Ischnura elegans]|uniref:WD repeat-containing protein 73-like n=1 Tax=Ischnura elegans TaxID=197161 RepID=UPI001ED86B15|nr:WD repeat-containing protein 73-like [Ischnura elegans]
MEFYARSVPPDPIMFEDNDDDDWYYDSIVRFQQLQMFDFDSPVTHVDFSENDQICIAGKIRGDRQEVQELSLPEKNSSSAFESHDLKMKTGGFSTKPIFQMKCLKNQRKMVLSENTLKGVSVYQLGCEKSDDIKKLCEFASEITNPLLAVFDKRIVFGSSSNEIHVANAEVNKVDLIVPSNCPQERETEIADLCTWSDNFVGYCESQTGKVTLIDCRSLERKSFSSLPSKLADSVNARFSLSVQENGNLIGVLSSGGHVSLFDLRGASDSPLYKVEVCPDSSSEGKELPLILFSPLQDRFFSVSGVSVGVSVYRLGESDAKSVFCYDGHSRIKSKTNVHVINHIWSPINENMLYSSANDGSFHCWQFIENKLA